MIDQLSIFELDYTLIESKEPSILEIGTIAKVKIPSPNLDAEDYYYLLSFQKKTGKVISIHNGSTSSYVLQFDKEQGIFYSQDLEIISV